MKSKSIIERLYAPISAVTQHGIRESYDIHSCDVTQENISFSNWQWRPLLQLCKRVSAIEALDIDFDSWDFNDGRGLNSHQECIELASAIRKHAAKFADPESKIRMTRPEGEIRPHHWIHLDDVMAFADFLDVCGGFKIW